MEHRRGVGKEHPQSHLIQILSVVVFVLVWGVDSFILKFSTFLEPFIPLIIRVIVFIVLAGGGLILILRGGHELFHNKNSTSNLVRSGLFAYVRHPLYLGVQFIYLGCIFLTSSLLALLVWIPILIFYDKLATYEEEDLERRFGEEYLEFKKKVSKWFPKIK